MKRKVAYFREWGIQTKVYNKTFKHFEYCMEDGIFITPFGRKMLEFFWCKFEPRKVDLRYCDDFGKTINKFNSQFTIFQCVPGFLLEKIYERKKISNDSSN